MTPFLRKLLGQNWLLLLTMLSLAVFGVVAIYSATSTRADSNAVDFWRKQANWVVVGVFAFMLTSLIHYRWIRWGALPMYLAGIVFLILTKFIGTKVYGARSWLHLGPVNFQPAQLAVIAGIMVLALFLTQFREMHPMLRLLLCGAIAAAPCLLILMQPDLGEVIIWGPVLLALLFAGGLPLRYLICVILIAVAFIPIAINFGLKPYQQQRITAFTHPDIDKQWGFIGGMFLLGGFALLLITCLFVAFFAGDQLGLLLVVGITALIFTHIFQNMGMTIALLPITGVPLPLISYSGSFVLMIMFGLGLVNSVWIHRKIPA